MKLFELTKRLGQQHWSYPNAGVTLCGVPMLGNNYSHLLAEADKVTCTVCSRIEAEGFDPQPVTANEGDY